jgi:hypothetical protein
MKQTFFAIGLVVFAPGTQACATELKEYGKGAKSLFRPSIPRRLISSHVTQSSYFWKASFAI